MIAHDKALTCTMMIFRTVVVFSVQYNLVIIFSINFTTHEQLGTYIIINLNLHNNVLYS